MLNFENAQICAGGVVVTDLISRQAALEAVGDVHPLDYNGQAILHRIQQLTPIDPKKFIEDYCRPRNLMVVGAECFRLFTEPKPVKWIAEPNCWYRCSNCGQHYPSIRGYMDYNYCPNCGAKMESE